MEYNVQLFMRRDNLDNLPPLALKEGFGLHTHVEGQEAVWEEIVEKAFNHHYSFKDWLLPRGGYRPEYILYVSNNGKDVATAMGTENPQFPGEGWLRMIAAVPEIRGQGEGRLVILAVLHSLAARGYKSVVLSTDDHRLPALAVYKALGFEPLMTDESHPERWRIVEEKLAQHQKEKQARLAQKESN